MRVAFGGSFNPPTIAHEQIIAELAKRYEEVIIIPNGSRYHHKALVSDDKRYEMLKLICDKYHNVTISTLEFKRDFKGTFQTLRDLGHPIFACGDDCLTDLKNWLNAKELLSENHFLIFTRNKKINILEALIKKDSFLQAYQDHFTFLSLNYPDISSSNYRAVFDEAIISQAINNYIHENKLYMEERMFNQNYLKVALATPKVHLGKPMANAEEILNVMNEINKAWIVAFPELSLTGYNLGDWVYNNELLNEAEDALCYLKEHSGKTAMIVGLPFRYAGRLYNCAAVLQNKHLLGLVPKVTLPSTKEFYETRFFSSGKSYFEKPLMIKLRGEDVPFGQILFVNDEYQVKFGVEICGDLWGQYHPYQKLYQNGAEMVFNLSASTFYVGKRKERKTLVDAASNLYKGAYLYTSAGPSDTTSDITFTGHELASICGETLLDEETLTLENVVNYVDVDLEYIRFARYSNGYSHNNENSTALLSEFYLQDSEGYLLEKKPSFEPFIPKTSDGFNEIINVVTTSLKHRLDHIGIDKVVLGISGGLDSTLALLFAYDTFKRYNMDVKNIYAFTLPGLATSSKSKNLAVSLMNKLEVTSLEVSIKKEALNQLKLLGHDQQVKDVTYENVQARLRTMFLMNKANELGAIVLGTSDMSEIALGWSTFNGDQMAMYNLNAGIPKTVVKALVKYYIDVYPDIKLELKKVYHAIITPELTSSDQATEDKIGKYQINDFIMFHLFNRGASKERIIFLLEICFGLKKMEAQTYYENFMNRFNHNQFKRLAAPEGIKIFEFSFSPRGEFRYPGDIK